MKKVRNQLLNIAEALCTFLVIFIHFPLPGWAGSIVTAIARVSVPFFFCISGYFLYRGNAEQELASIPRKVKRLIYLILSSEIVYFLFYLALQVNNSGFSVQAVSAVLNAYVVKLYGSNIGVLLSVFAPVFNGVLWFAGSLIATYITFWVAAKLGLKATSHLYIYAIIILWAGIFLNRVLLCAGVNTDFPYQRILPMLPLPFFVCGYYLHKEKERFDRISDKTYLGILAVGLILTVVEQFFGGYILYFGTPLLVFSSIALCSKHDSYATKTILGRWLSHIGEASATYIYVLHILVANVLSVVLPRILPVFKNHPIYLWCFPFLVCLFTELGAEIVFFAKNTCLLRFSVQGQAQDKH